MTSDLDARGWKARAEAAEARLKEVEKERDELRAAVRSLKHMAGASNGEARDANDRLEEVEKERDKYARACTTMVEKLNEVEKDRDYFAEQSKVAQKLVGTYREELAAARRCVELLRAKTVAHWEPLRHPEHMAKGIVVISRWQPEKDALDAYDKVRGQAKSEQGGGHE